MAGCVAPKLAAACACASRRPPRPTSPSQARDEARERAAAAGSRRAELRKIVNPDLGARSPFGASCDALAVAGAAAEGEVRVVCD